MYEHLYARNVSTRLKCVRLSERRNIVSFPGLRNKSYLRGDDLILLNDCGRCRGVLSVRRVVVLRLHLLLFHHPDDHRLRRHGRATKGQRAEQQAGIRDVRPDIHFVRLGYRRRLPQFIGAEICHYEYGGREARRGRGSTGKETSRQLSSSIEVSIF